MQTDTTLTWTLLVLVLFMAFLGGTSISSNPLVQGAAMMLDIPFMIAGAFGAMSVVIAAVMAFVLINYYFHGVLEGTVGEGVLLFVVISVFAVMFGV